MRSRMTAALAGAVTLFGCHAEAADRPMTIAVFTKNTTNPAYEAFRIAADQVGRSAGARILHFVPKQPDARRVMEKCLAEHPQLDAVLSANDSMALGALEALKAANRTAIVIGINGILPAVKLIETGGILASVDFNMFKIGCAATRAALRQLNHQSLPDKVILPAEIIEKTNYEAWLVPVEQRSCPQWDEFLRK